MATGGYESRTFTSKLLERHDAFLVSVRHYITTGLETSLNAKLVYKLVSHI